MQKTRLGIDKGMCNREIVIHPFPTHVVSREYTVDKCLAKHLQKHVIFQQSRVIESACHMVVKGSIANSSHQRGMII